MNMLDSYKNSGLISVVIPTYNQANFLADAIDSVLNQSYTNLELIVVNDGSTDGTSILLEKYKEKINIIEKKNEGVSSARNAGLQKARGEYIAFLDSDDLWIREKLELQIQKFQEKSNIGLVYSGIRVVSENLESIETINPRFKGDVWIKYLKFPAVAITLLGCSTSLIRMDVARQIGYFDLNLSIAADWDYFRRISDVTNLEFIDDPLTLYRKVNGSMSSVALFIYYQEAYKAYKKAIEEWLELRRISRLSAWLHLKKFLLQINLILLVQRQFKDLIAFNLKIFQKQDSSLCNNFSCRSTFK